MSSNWRSIVNPVKDGEPVDEATSNRSIDALVERTDWLKNRIEGLDPSSGRLSFSGATVNSTVNVGDWVFFDESEDRFDRALAELEWNDSINAFVPSRRSLVVGLVTQKLTSTSAVVTIRGTGITITDLSGISDMVDLLQSAEESFTPGRYYLSTVTPGKMTKFPSGAPLIPLGVFSESFSTIAPDVKEVFEAHLHHRFQLYARPGSSQQDAPGWSYRDNGSSQDVSYVDYRFDGTSLIQLSVRRNPTSAPSKVAARVEFSRTDADKLKIDIYDAPDRSNPSDISVPKLETVTMDWPSYGEEIVVGSSVGLDLIVAFVRVDFEVSDRHTDSLAQDIESGTYIGVNQKWSLYVPDDLKGWTNANPVDPRTPDNALYRYMVESHHDLYSMFPPVPSQGLVLFEDGQIKPSNEYDVTHLGIWWFGGVYTGDSDSNVPWVWDHDERIFGFSMSGTKKDLFLTMSTNPLGPVDSVVKCLVSNSSFLKISRLGGDTPASAGRLEVTLNLGLAISTRTMVDSKRAIVGVSEDGNEFEVGHNVSQLIAGPNIRLKNVAPDDSESETGPFTGKIKVEAVIPSMSGDAVSMTLFNAKESEKNGIIYTEFLRPSVARTAAVARIKIPNFDPGDGIILLRLFAKFLGDTNVSDGNKKAIFKVDYRVARAGRNISTTLASPQRTEGWIVDFSDGYLAFKVLDNELPVYGETIKKQPNNNVFNLTGAGVLRPNDVVSVRFERVANSTPFQVGDQSSLSGNTLGTDDYAGSVGLLDLRWTIELD